MHNESIKGFRLQGEDGNAFAIIGRFKMAAKRAGWKKEDIDKVVETAMSGDYDNLISTFLQWSED